jgi:Ca2+:H+ antiporter
LFAAIDTNNNNGSGDATSPSDTLRNVFLHISRSFAVILLVTYVGSRFYLPDPPHERKAVEPEVNSLACFIFLAVTVVLMGVTTEFGGIGEEWFGIVLLPVASFSANAIVAITFFIGRWLKERLGKTESPTRASSSYSSGCRFSVGGPTIPCQCSSIY